MPGGLTDRVCVKKGPEGGEGLFFEDSSELSKAGAKSGR